jgi:hypothetical protein
MQNYVIPKTSVKDNAAYNKSLDVRAKERLSYHAVFLLLAGLVAVSPHVNFAVKQL